MRTIGLLGGMSFESSAVYYRWINEFVRRKMGGLHSAEMVLYSVDFQSVVDLQLAGKWGEAGQRLAAVAGRIEQAGAECVLICTNTMHLVADAVQAAIGVPLINIIDETARRLAEAGYRRPLLLATRYTMEQGFYADRMRGHGLDIVLPQQADRALTHGIIFDELCAGKVEGASRRALLEVIARGRSQGADAVILGCTELGMILDPTDLPLTAFDSTMIHCEAAVAFALAG